MNLSIKQLRAFLALAEAENFTRASEKVNLSQPAFSALIASLEQEIGYRLFDRDTRKVQLNSDGLHFIELARTMVHTYDNTVNEIRVRSKGEEGRVTLAVLPSIAVQWVPELLVEFNKQNPNIHVELMDTQWDRCLQSIINHTADLALTAGTPSLNELSSEVLFSDNFYLICHKDHPLASKEYVELSDLEHQPLIAFSQGTSIRIYTDQLIQFHNIRYILEVRQLTTMMGMVASNYGISIVTGLTLFQFEHHNIAIVPFKDVSLRRAVYLIKSRDKTLSIPAQKLYDFIKESAEKKFQA
ncbi:LysR family transcriptional regulator [Zophobihabitans entericus]|uniref:LysR family transcriptional regulator n=1 Tax=Zophobihabitans entericus TaxID=1635327 RepID=A0A6G9ICQ6_9GAMM|nr:LysR family transcriptional regulator [Zophobihabitans entericus]QIQ21599.1 LysR family transcriptional regulator [Zophobihabitans entericus]